ETQESVLGPAAYLSQIEELPTTVNEEQVETLEYKIEAMELAKELAEEQ
ncbi:7646_t:CDS:1, partial [Acaulospora morrowiae]